MIDLHTHSLFSDGVLIPSELVYRSLVKGYEVIAITDHGDFSNMDFIIPRIKKAAKILSVNYCIRVIPGIELTYVPPQLMKKAVLEARKLGARIVIVHGETTAETVPPGTNRAGILARADIIAHPGFIEEEEVKLAKKLGVCLEITTREGHNRTNEHVAKLAVITGAKLVLNTDSHQPSDFMTNDKIIKTLKMSGLDAKDYERMKNNSYDIVKRCLKGKN